MRVCVERYKRGYIEEGIKRADALLGKKLCETYEKDYLRYFENGNRLIYEKQYFGKRESLTVFGTLLSIEEDVLSYGYEIKEEYVDKLFATIESVLREKTWVLPAHAAKEHITGNRKSIDLFAAETAGTLSEILWRIRENESVKTKYKKKYEKLLELFLERFRTDIYDLFVEKEPCDWWENANMNWAAVCSGNIFISFYYVKRLKKDMISDDIYEKVSKRVKKSMANYLLGMPKDGACLEGSGYYKYGMEYFLGFLELYYLEYKEMIFEFSNLAKYLQRVYLGNGMSVNFSDCEICSKMKMGMVSYMSSIYEGVGIHRDFVTEENGKSMLLFKKEMCECFGGDECHRFLGSLRDYLWVEKYGKNLMVCDREKEVFFEDASWYIRNMDNASFYIKGGCNEEPHNHNDIGSFGLIVGGEEMLLDIGVGEYTKDYFNESRYEHLCTSSRGHNLPVVDKRLQKAGKNRCATMFETNENLVFIEYGKAYDLPKESVTRKVVFDEGNNKICIKDSIEGKVIEEHFITKIKPIVTGESVEIRGEKSGVRIEFGNCEPVKNLEIQEENINNHSGEKEKIYLICAEYFSEKVIKDIEIYVNLL